MSEDKPQQVDFNIVPDDSVDFSRAYANFCAVQNSPFDFTLTFCEMHPPTDKQLRDAQATHVIKAPVRARIAVPVQMVPGLIAALQENFRLYQQSFGPTRGAVN